MRPDYEIEDVFALSDWGYSPTEIASETRIPDRTIRLWLDAGPALLEKRQARRKTREINIAVLPKQEYAYLLGLYLGDGCISACPRDVFKMRTLSMPLTRALSTSAAKPWRLSCQASAPIA
jgi:hypothetical protein